MLRQESNHLNSSFPRRLLIPIVLIVMVLGAVTIFGAASTAQAAQAVPQYYDSLPPAGSVIAPYVTAASWAKTTLTYRIINCPKSLDCTEAQNSIRQAAAAWDAASGLTLVETSGNADIDVGWFSGQHGDGNPFDGPGEILAHAFFPLSWLGSLAGDVHLDDDETWVVNPPTRPWQIHLTTSVMHEMGHALGLDHSGDPASLMWAEYVGVRGLGADDIAGIQALYGPPGPGEGSPPPAPANPSGATGVTATAQTSLRLRSGPDTSFGQVGLVPNATVLPVIGKNAQGNWLYVDFNGTRGWVAGWYTSIQGDLAAVPVVSNDGGGAAPAPPAPDEPTNPGDVTALASTNIRMRSGPGTDYSQVGTVSAGNTVPILARNSSANWLLVLNNGQTGWIAAWLVTINGDINTVPVQE